MCTCAQGVHVCPLARLSGFELPPRALKVSERLPRKVLDCIRTSAGAPTSGLQIFDCHEAGTVAVVKIKSWREPFKPRGDFKLGKAWACQSGLGFVLGAQATLAEWTVGVTAASARPWADLVKGLRAASARVGVTAARTLLNRCAWRFVVCVPA